MVNTGPYRKPEDKDKYMVPVTYRGRNEMDLREVRGRTIAHVEYYPPPDAGDGGTGRLELLLRESGSEDIVLNVEIAYGNSISVTKDLEEG